MMLVKAKMHAAMINIIPNVPVMILPINSAATMAANTNLIILSALLKFFFIVIKFIISPAKLQCILPSHSDYYHIRASFLKSCI